MLPPRTATGETISITNRGNPMDWEDDEDGAKTAIAQPGEIAGLLSMRANRRPPPSPVAFTADPADQQASVPSLQQVDSFDDVAMVKPRRAGLVIALLVLALLAVGGLLVLFDVIPLPRFPASGKKVGLLVPSSTEKRSRS